MPPLLHYHSGPARQRPLVRRVLLLDLKSAVGEVSFKLTMYNTSLLKDTQNWGPAPILREWTPVFLGSLPGCFCMLSSPRKDWCLRVILIDIGRAA